MSVSAYRRSRGITEPRQEAALWDARIVPERLVIDLEDIMSVAPAPVLADMLHHVSAARDITSGILVPGVEAIMSVRPSVPVASAPPDTERTS